MLHKAWNSKGEMPYCFPRSSIKFQGHMGQNITDFDPNWAFPDYRPVAAFKSLRFALFFNSQSLILTCRSISKINMHKFYILTKLILMKLINSNILIKEQFEISHRFTSINLIQFCCFMLTSSNGNIFRVTGPLCEEFTGHRWISLTKASDAELWCFLWSAAE